MGYDISIVRYNGDVAVDIPEHEWLEYVQTDPELEPSDMSTETDTYFEWNAHSRHNNPEEGRPWFAHSIGRILSKNPDTEVAAKAYRIATALHAKVKGDDGEFYDEHGKPVIDPSRRDEPIHFPRSKPWWRFW